jgi:two-component system osmolarity sensor histidine kinase EnvZ
MRRFLQSLYARLALVLLLAMGASYATMYLLFQSRLADTREQQLARNLAVQVNLVEALLRAQPAADLTALKDVTLARQAPPAAQALHPEFLASLRQALIEELGRDVEVLPTSPPGRGIWLNLKTGAGEPRWLFFAAPHPPHPRRSDSILTALIVGFAVFFAGGLALLWQVHRPLKRLGEAMEAVGKSSHPVRLPETGPGELRHLGRRYNDMLMRLQGYEEDRATMLAGVAHDLRTPMTRLRLLAELSEGARADEIVRNLADMERITEQFLDYARGSNDEAWEERDLDLFVQEVAAPYGDRVGVSVSEGSNAAPVKMRANALRRALVNLIENALEYGAPPVTVAAVRRDGQVGIAVEDHGGGIAEDQMERALRPFTRLDDSRGGKGHCGLGLMIAARAAEAHGGALQLRNRAVGGLVAEICWPG